MLETLTLRSHKVHHEWHNIVANKFLYFFLDFFLISIYIFFFAWAPNKKYKILNYHANIIQ